MKRAIKQNAPMIAVILGLVAVALACTTYIVIKQRLKLPFQDVYRMNAEFVQTAGLTPGLGQQVNVAGVKVGTVAGVEVRNGRAVVLMDIERKKLARVYENAHATMVPNTPAKDLVVEVAPGRPPARPLPEDGTIPVARTSPQIEADELLAALDTDTRQYFQALIGGLSLGTRGRGEDARELFKTLGPTAEQLQPLMAELATRRRELRRLVHNLGLIARAAGSRDRELARVVVSANATVQALAGQEAALRASVRKLPGTLATARSSLEKATPFARRLAPAARALLPAVRKLPEALRATGPLLATAEPVLRRQVRPFVRDLQPLARDLGPAAVDLTKVTPYLTNAFRVLNYVANELGHNPPGSDEGYLHWLAWFVHNANSFLSTEDAAGAVWRGLFLSSCDTLKRSALIGSLLAPLIGDQPGCKETG
jgi:phospholipid/cholesterol/gamma-HCH transport system substrate-binding protein